MGERASLFQQCLSKERKIYTYAKGETSEINLRQQTWSLSRYRSLDSRSLALGLLSGFESTITLSMFIYNNNVIYAVCQKVGGSRFQGQPRITNII